MEENEDNNSQPTVEELTKKIASMEESNSKMQAGYKKVEAERNQLESGYKNLGIQLEKSGVGKIDLADGQMKISLNQAKESNEPSELDTLVKDKANLKAKFDNDEITESEYYETLSEYNGEISAIKRIAKRDKEQERIRVEADQQRTSKEWTSKIITEYPDASNTQSELYKEMNRLAIKEVNYMEDMSRYYELASRASDNLKAKSGTPNTPEDHSNDFESLSNQNRGSYNPNPTSQQTGITDSDKKELIVKFGKEGYARIEKQMSANLKMGSLVQGDTNMTSSQVYLEI